MQLFSVLFTWLFLAATSRAVLPEDAFSKVWSTYAKQLSLNVNVDRNDFIVEPEKVANSYDYWLWNIKPNPTAEEAQVSQPLTEGTSQHGRPAEATQSFPPDVFRMPPDVYLELDQSVLEVKKKKLLAKSREPGLEKRTRDFIRASWPIHPTHLVELVAALEAEAQRFPEPDIDWEFNDAITRLRRAPTKKVSIPQKLTSPADRDVYAPLMYAMHGGDEAYVADTLEAPDSLTFTYTRRLQELLLTYVRSGKRPQNLYYQAFERYLILMRTDWTPPKPEAPTPSRLGPKVSKCIQRLTEKHKWSTDPACKNEAYYAVWDIVARRAILREEGKMSRHVVEKLRFHFEKLTNALKKQVLAGTHELYTSQTRVMRAPTYPEAEIAIVHALMDQIKGDFDDRMVVAMTAWSRKSKEAGSRGERAIRASEYWSKTPEAALSRAEP